MPLELDPQAGGSAGNATFLGTACELAYLNDPEATPAFKEKLGLDGRLIAVGNTQVFIGTNDTSIVAAFRGTESPTTIDGLKDWLLTNAMNFLVLPEGEMGTDFAAAGVGARFHAGFLTALAMIWKPFFESVKTLVQDTERPLWLTGHSLGGALAVLAAWRLERKIIKVHQVTTFGAPMVGNQQAADAYTARFDGRIFRYVDSLDFIPHLPTISLVANTYTHCLREMPINEATDGTAQSILQSMSAKAAEGLLTPSLIDELWAVLNDRIGAHQMGNYLSRLGSK